MYAAQLLPDYEECVILREALADYVKEPNDKSERQIALAWKLLAKLTNDMTRGK
jgi:hypothetical protein